MDEEKSIIFVTARKLKKYVVTLENLVLQAGTDAAVKPDMFVNGLNGNLHANLDCINQKHSKNIKISKGKRFSQ